VKWGFIPPTNTKPVYLICNADESEPGTFKDRYIMHQDPHQLIEGMVISCLRGWSQALPTSTSARNSPTQPRSSKKPSLRHVRRASWAKTSSAPAFDCEIYVHRGAGAYICGEETGLIESLEGKRPYPRIKPPYFPAALGLYMSPTIVNNVESLCHVKHILQMGGAEYAKLGTPNNTGTRILCVSGDVQKPGYYEVEVGKVTMGEVINDLCGGLKPGARSKPSSLVDRPRKS
jgi:NADH-quinone oxidoreductase subunit F